MFAYLSHCVEVALHTKDELDEVAGQLTPEPTPDSDADDMSKTQYDWVIIGQFYIDHNLRADTPLSEDDWAKLCSLQPFLNLLDRSVDEVINDTALRNKFGKSAKSYLSTEKWILEPPEGFQLPVPENHADRMKPSKVLTPLWEAPQVQEQAVPPQAEKKQDDSEAQSEECTTTQQLSDLLQAAQCALAEEKSQNSSLQDQIHARDEDAKSIRDRNAELQAENNQFVNQIIELETSLQDQTTSLQDRNTSLQDRNTSLQDENTSLQDEKTSLRARITSLQDGNTNLQHQTTSLQIENTKLHTQLTSLELKLDEARNKPSNPIPISSPPTPTPVAKIPLTNTPADKNPNSYPTFSAFDIARLEYLKQEWDTAIREFQLRWHVLVKHEEKMGSCLQGCTEEWRGELLAVRMGGGGDQEGKEKRKDEGKGKGRNEGKRERRNPYMD